MALYSSYWYRVAHIVPRLRRHVQLFRHQYRDQQWYILQDPTSGRQHRFSLVAYRVIGLMDGKRSVQEIWDSCNATLGDESPTQDEVIGLLGKLHSVDVLQSDTSPDDLEIFERQKKRRGQWKARVKNPFALRFPLVDPDAFLTKWAKFVTPFVRPVFIFIWLLVVGAACFLAAVNWVSLTHNVGDRILRPENLLMLWLIYPVVKLLHELGHAFLTKIWGGEVHEMGIMLLAFTPIPYVEASASVSFTSKYKRMGVAAAGMAVELFVASLALFLWLAVEEGQVSGVAFNVMLIGGVSTILFNGNPLLRFDGYYILSDWIEIPNLAKRSGKYLGYLLQRYLFGIKEANSPVTAAGEKPWFVGYGIASFCYRMFVLTALSLFICSKFLLLGSLVAAWAFSTQIILPLVRNSYNFYNSSGGRRSRARFISASLATLLALVVVLFAVPAPLKTKAEGFVSLPDYSKVRAGTPCVIEEIVSAADSYVKKGDPLIRCEDPFLQAEYQVLEANLKEAVARYHAVPLKSRVDKEIIKEEIRSVNAALKRAAEKMSELLVKSQTQGQFVLPDAENLTGRFVEQGDLIGYVMGALEATVNVVVSQRDIHLVRERTKSVELRLIGRFDQSFTAEIDREIPAASKYLPSAVLGTMGGGEVSVDPGDKQGLRSLEKMFQVEIKLPIPTEQIRIGQRVYALFDHGYEPLALQWYRAARQLFLHRFNV